MEDFVDKFGFETLSARDKHGYTPGKLFDSVQASIAWFLFAGFFLLLAHWVALDGNAEMMHYLVKRNAPIDLGCLGTQGPRPIHWACRKGHAGM